MYFFYLVSVERLVSGDRDSVIIDLDYFQYVYVEITVMEMDKILYTKIINIVFHFLILLQQYLRSFYVSRTVAPSGRSHTDSPPSSGV